MNRLDELKAQRLQLGDLVRTGVLTGDAAREACDRLEAQIAAAMAPAAGGAATDIGTQAGPGSAAAARVAVAAAARPSHGLRLGLLVFVLCFGAAGYAWLGNPAGLAVAPGKAVPAAPEAASLRPSQADITAMVERLVERLKTTPDDVEGWTMLGRSYSVLERFELALQAFQRVLALRPQDAQAHADVAEAMAMAMAMTNDRPLDGEPERLIARALVLDPDNAKALGLAGTIAFERGDGATAARHWERVLKAARPDSEMARRLREAVDEARKRAGLAALPLAAATTAATAATTATATATTTATARVAAIAAAAAPTGPPGAGSDGAPVGPAAAVQARITLAPALAARAAPGDTVFIFARSAQGGKAPLAIQRRQVQDLPLDITLDDSMAMSPAMRLSTVSQVVIGARISKSGNAMPQPGDLQGLSAVVAVGSRGLQLQISEVLP